MADELAKYNEFTPQIQGLERQRKMAQMLMQQGLQQPQGQMVSGHYVAPSWTQHLAGLGNILGGMYKEKNVDEKALDLARQLRGKQEEAVQEYFDALQPGAPTERVYASNVGPAIEMVQGKPDYQRAFKAATRDFAPSWLTSMAVKQLEPVKLGEGEQIMQRNPITGELTPLASGAQKKSNEMRNYEEAVKQGFKGSFIDYELNLKRAGASVSNTIVNTGQRGFQNYMEMKNSFKAEPIYKAYQEVQGAHSQIMSGLNAKSPAGDLAAATKFMKILDPGSVVRESELGMAMKASGLMDRLTNYANMVKTGQKLTPAQREDFRNMSNQFFNATVNQYNTKRNEYANVAKQFDLNPSLAVGNEIKSVETKSTW